MPSPHACLNLRRIPTGLRVALFERDEHEMIPRGFEEIHVDFEEVDRIIEDFKFLLERANLFGQMGAGASAEIERLALLLFDELIPPSLKGILRKGEGSLAFRLDETLLHIPWELLHSGERYLAQQYSFSRLICFEGISKPPPSRSLASKKRRVLILCDPRDDLPASEEEGWMLRESFNLHPSIELGFRSAPISRSYVRENLREYDIVHFAGHAEWDGEGNGWLLCDGRFLPEDIRRIAGSKPMPALVFANACSSIIAPHIARDDMARALLSAGTINVIGTLWDIPDRIGSLFAEHLYRQLLEGASVGEALRRTRVEMAKKHGEGTVLWGSYVLYGPSEVVYFDPAIHAETLTQPAQDHRKGSPNPSREGNPESPLHEPSPLVLPPLDLIPELLPSPISPRPTLRNNDVYPLPEVGHVTQFRKQINGFIFFFLSLFITGALGIFLLDAPPDFLKVLQSKTSQGPAPPPSPSLIPAARTLSPTKYEAPRELKVTLEVQAQIMDAHGDLREVNISSGDALHSQDRLRLALKVDADVYVQILHLRSNGSVQSLTALKEGGHLLLNDEQLSIPDAQSWFQIDGEPGPELIAVLVSRSHLKSIEVLARDLGMMILNAHPPLFEPSGSFEFRESVDTWRTLPLERLRAHTLKNADSVTFFEIDHRP